MSAARLASLASGRGGIPEPGEWPFVIALLLLVALVGTRLLMALGLTRVEALLVAALSPLLVLFDAPIGRLSPSVNLAANLAGCLIPSAVAVKVVLERRAPLAEAFFLIAVGVVVSYFSSHVVADRGVLLQYRIPAVVVGVLAAGLLYKEPERAGAAGFAAGALGVVIGADVLHLTELSAGAGRVILAAAVGELLAMVLRTITRSRAPTAPPV